MKDSLGGDLSISTMSGLSQLGGNSMYYQSDSAMSIDTDLSGAMGGGMQGGPHTRVGAQAAAAAAAKAEYGMQKKG